MADDELAAIRAKRMAEMQAQAGPGGNSAQKAQEKQMAMEDMKNSILSQVLSQEARARLNTLSLAKPEKGQRIQGAIIQMAQTGQISGKLGESDLIGLLERFSGSSVQTKVKFDRRRAALDSDED
uniref:Programmed cell death protein 5 n=1 Tax=Caligus rogercresseyi TaxID=217165 RepID=C1BRB0_CALRO|nr:Programmed cell death protein 5 [Caligus rogercresseyi]|eukprot:TRINITY_DN3106_c0_g1_i1.p1 TRINITY_DN3106_c0_g1~~TRINITY_DN3106_c0_g1_i1.p1  ORF type:complete len:125 (-),score=48.26 TRINITY_DN3106_c0_g1_i1:156-530(-)